MDHRAVDVDVDVDVDVGLSHGEKALIILCCGTCELGIR